MTAVILVGLMVALALILSITWIEPHVLGGPAGSSGEEEVHDGSPRALGALGSDSRSPVEAPTRKAA